MRSRITVLLLLLAVFALIGCSPDDDDATDPTTPPLAETLTLYHYADAIPQSILDQFTAETGVKIDYKNFASYEDAIASIAAGNTYDVVWLSNAHVSTARLAGLLRQVNYANVPNIRNIDANFRDLAYDPRNEHSVPLTWGTTGLLVRTDLVEVPYNSWNVLWEVPPQQVGIWNDQRTMIAVTLQALGFNTSSADPAELAAAQERLLELRKQAVFMEEFDPWTSAYELDKGTISVAVGWAYDALTGQGLNPNIAYVIPDEGTVLWLESLAIPTTSTEQYTAEVFINFMLRPEIMGQYANEVLYAVTSSAANEFVSPELLNNPAVYPTDEMLVRAEVFLPVNAEVDSEYNALWQAFLDAPTE